MDKSNNEYDKLQDKYTELEIKYSELEAKYEDATSFLNSIYYIKCDTCFDWKSSDYMSGCDICSNNVCLDHDNCYYCDNKYCGKCLPLELFKCIKCERYSCSDHIEKCNVCDDKYCKGCDFKLKSCNKCEEKICTVHIKICAECKSEYCEKCYIVEADNCENNNLNKKCNYCHYKKCAECWDQLKFKYLNTDLQKQIEMFMLSIYHLKNTFILPPKYVRISIIRNIIYNYKLIKDIKDKYKEYIETKSIDVVEYKFKTNLYYEVKSRFILYVNAASNIICIGKDEALDGNIKPLNSIDLEISKYIGWIYDPSSDGLTKLI